MEAAELGDDFFSDSSIDQMLDEMDELHNRIERQKVSLSLLKEKRLSYEKTAKAQEELDALQQQVKSERESIATYNQEHSYHHVQSQVETLKTRLRILKEKKKKLEQTEQERQTLDELRKLICIEKLELSSLLSADTDQNYKTEGRLSLCDEFEKLKAKLSVLRERRHELEMKKKANDQLADIHRQIVDERNVVASLASVSEMERSEEDIEKATTKAKYRLEKLKEKRLQLEQQEIARQELSKIQDEIKFEQKKISSLRPDQNTETETAENLE